MRNVCLLQYSFLFCFFLLNLACLVALQSTVDGE